VKKCIIRAYFWLGRKRFIIFGETFGSVDGLSPPKSSHNCAKRKKRPDGSAELKVTLEQLACVKELV